MREGWGYDKLGDLGTIVTGSTPSTKDATNYFPKEYCFVKPSDFPIEGIGNINETENYVSSKGLSASRPLPVGSVLTTCIGTIGKVGILLQKGCTNQQINAVITNSKINSRYLAYALLSIRKQLEFIANAPVVPIINKNNFSKIQIGYPPKSTQLSIVSELDKINELIRIKKEQLKDYDTLAQSIFYEMFGDPVENEKGWEVKKFGELFKLKSGDGLSSKDFKTGDYPVYGGNGISGYHNSFNMNGNYIIIGRVGVYCGNVRKVGGKFWLTDNAFKLIYHENEQVSVFILYLLNILDLHQYANAAAQPVISNLTLKSVNIPLPPLPLQYSFAHKIEQIEHQKATVQKAITDLETLLASRMQYWFG